MFNMIPRSTVTTYAIQTVEGCPPNTSSGYACPGSTGANDGSTSGQLSCPMQASDGFTGYCRYSSSDGTSRDSVLVRTNGTSDSADDETRMANYGDFSVGSSSTKDQ